MSLAWAPPALAREQEPDPIADPGECPIDAPVRIASLDSLRHFEGLIGHCAETQIIESPAFRANRPNGGERLPTAADAWIEERGIENDGGNDPRLLLTRAPRGAKARASSEPDATPSYTVRRKGDGSAVAIVPPAEAFPEPVSVVPVPGAAAAAVDTDGDGDIEAILALRPRSYTTAFDQKIAAAARRHAVDPLLLHAVITQESRYKHRAVSHAGARGLMQVMPATGRGLGVRDPGHLFDPDTNINAGAKLLSQLWRNLDGNVDLVLAAYNAGEGAVRKYGMTVPPYRETRDYVVKVKSYYVKLAGENGLAVNF